MTKKPLPDSKKSARQKLIELARPQQKAAPMTEHEDSIKNSSSHEKKSGWIPWFSENTLFLLGWVENTQTQVVYGVELELAALLSRLIVDFPGITHKGAAMVLMDGKGDVMHQTGIFAANFQQKPRATVPVSNLLPHWRMGVYMDDKAFGAGNGFLYVSMILLAIFVAAIFFGGALLTRQANANKKDAMQKTSFVSSVSHELKTPLTSIRMYAELLMSQRVKTEEKKGQYLSIIVNESQRLTRLINNVLDFGRLEEKKKKYQITSFDLARFLIDMIEIHSIRIKAVGFKIKMQIPDMPFPVKTDRDCLEQVVLNLVDNALKYADGGKFIQFDLKAFTSEFFLLKISDRGPGIPKAHQKKIFNKFHRVDNSLTSKQQGSGLGLSIARQLLRDLGGDLLYEPGVKKGSCFIARINRNGTC
ncbi:MAG: HAMP domain-containing histidine kinase, partial [Desulfobacteraceae bacterium]|nr:HAMP domain-containing histidine kinase [Desulfobacteraceae bacterium]